MLYWLLKRMVLGPLLLTLYRPWVEGREHVPDHGGALIVSNHLSFSDSIFLPLVLDRRVTFLAKDEYFTGSGVRGRLTAGFFRGVGQLPVDRSGGAAGLASLRTGLGVLGRGDLLGIYPEGTRSPDGRLHRGRTGAARLALESGVPVVPVAMIGTDAVQPVGKLLPAVRRVGIRFGPPVDVARYAGRGDDRFVLRAATDDIMRALMALSGQEYVDVYATVTKEALARQREAAEHGVALDLPTGAPAPGGLAPGEAGPERPRLDDEPPAPDAPVASDAETSPADDGPADAGPADGSGPGAGGGAGGPAGAPPVAPEGGVRRRLRRAAPPVRGAGPRDR
ncbi:1-acyl-sn-glycerol-3-phosphate acyltransferase [uncultured Pseudokineococcus sp.]|uniref:lysophospholipid acyltransferase family protein n=1 Tax=uncultured Pseudokineococcus sp. TaxID=1642928 RepID=UPI0026328ED7|nr:1-acyl-sn-glycerol-3-phosphate acyltransferase [uncultured Pseudokineococcus sp.]